MTPRDRDRDRQRRRGRMSDAEWLAANFPSNPTRPAGAGPDTFRAKVDDLVRRDAVDAAWHLCLDEGRAPERYGLFQDYDDDEWRAIGHFVDASGARYRWEWQAGDLIWPPSTLIVFGFVARQLNHRRITSDAMFGAATDPFEDGYDGRRDRNEDTCWLNAFHWRRLVVEHARDRYRRGFYADPFAAEPLARPKLH